MTDWDPDANYFRRLDVLSGEELDRASEARRVEAESLERLRRQRSPIRVGNRVRALRDFSGVPCGTEGVVDEDYGTGLMIAWDLPDRPLPEGWFWDANDHTKWAGAPGSPLRDGFDKERELKFLEIVE